MSRVQIPSGSSYSIQDTIYSGYTPITVTEYANAVVSTWNGQWTVYAGTMAQEIVDVVGGNTSASPNTQFSNPVLAALNAPFGQSGLAIWADPQNVNGALQGTETIHYHFSSPLPAGTSFLLWDPGSAESGGTFNVAASLGGHTVGTDGWTFDPQFPFGAATSSTFTINPAAGTVTESNYSGTMFPNSVVVLTTNAPIDDIGITASTNLFDYWGLTLPNIQPPINMNPPCQTVYQSMYGSAPDATELNILVQFSTNQAAYAVHIGVMSPTVYVYQALGLALNDGSAFRSGYAPNMMPNDVTFSVEAYIDIFHHAGTQAQTQHFVAQVNYFETIYTASGAYGTDAAYIDLLARGAVYGQMHGVAAMDPSAVYHAVLVGTPAASDASMGLF